MAQWFTVRLSDVADVVDGPEDLHGINYANGTPAVVLRVLRQPGANVVNTVERIKPALSVFASIPPTIDINILADRTETIRASASMTCSSRSSSPGPCGDGDLPVLAQPVGNRDPRGHRKPSAFIGTFAAMYAFGYSLDNLSFPMGLTIATGSSSMMPSSRLKISTAISSEASAARSCVEGLGRNRLTLR